MQNYFKSDPKRRKIQIQNISSYSLHAEVFLGKTTNPKLRQLWY